jgi:prepilin-type N-terminal cleavage/methylation domain-containing protein
MPPILPIEWLSRAGSPADSTPRADFMKRYGKGFTLLELLIVIMVLGVLCTIAISVLFNIRERAAVASIESDLVSAYKAAIDYHTDHPGTEVKRPLLLEHGYNPSPDVNLVVLNGFEETLMLEASHPLVSGLFQMDCTGRIISP